MLNRRHNDNRFMQAAYTPVMKEWNPGLSLERPMIFETKVSPFFVEFPFL